MKQLEVAILLLLCCQIFWVTARIKINKICVTEGFEQQCDRLNRETQDIKCVRVQDSIECAKLLRNGSSGFGIFSAESTLLLAALNYDGLAILKELRHRDRLNYTSDFESVVLVRATHKNGIEGLKGYKYCHPGLYYDRAERWSERFLKHFERTVTTPECKSQCPRSAAEIELAAVAEYFGPGCRPGAWSNNPEEDHKLKAKFPQLCELCPSTTSHCEYLDKNRHIGALRCLINKGDVAYVSLQDVQDFFSPVSEHAHLKSEYAYLCPDDTIQLLNDNSKPPCTWLRQPWPVIIASNDDSIQLSEGINRWSFASYGWESAIKDILTADDLTPVKTFIQKPRDFFYPYREVPYSLPVCTTTATWCTKSLEEKEKCDVIHTAGVTAGVYPVIECQEPVAGAISCLKEIADQRADFITIDSNLGYIARSTYNLTTALYGETEKKSPVAILVRANSPYNSIKDLKNAKACIAEFNGIASAAFINTGKKLGLLPKNRHGNSRLLSDFFGSTCAPGALDSSHGVVEFKDSLCSLCPTTGSGAVSAVRPLTEVPILPIGTLTPLNAEVELTGTSNLQNELDVLNNETKLNCNADRTNSFFGDLGALFCLHTKGDVAILGLKDLEAHAKALAINPNDFKLICRNGSVAQYTGFDVDPECVLGSFIDSEIVVRPQDRRTEGIINALLSFDKYFKHDPDFKIYAPFDGHKDLLFNNGTSELASFDEKGLGEAVDNYKKLFESLSAYGSAIQAIPAASIVVTTMIFSFIISCILQ